MKRYIIPAVVLTLVLVMVPAVAGGTLPGDRNADQILSRGELSWGVLDYLACGAGENCTGAPSGQDLIDAAYVFSAWGGKEKLVTDSAGNTRTLTRPLHRVVVMNSETLETMRSLGVNASLVAAVDKYTVQKPEFFPEYINKPSVGSIWAPDYERILSVRPDAVFLYATVSKAECDEIEQRISAADPSITVFRIDCYTPATYLDDARILGEIFDRQQESGRLAGFYTDIKNTVQAGGNDRPKVYFETWNDYKSASRGSGYHDKIEIAGGENIFADSVAEYPEVDPEAVIKAQPDVVVKLAGAGKLDFGGYSGKNATAFAQVQQSLLARPGWTSLPAAGSGRIHILHNGILGGPQYIIGVAYLASWFHPGQYPGLDTAALHRTYLREFQGLNESLADPRLFVYPVP